MKQILILFFAVIAFSVNAQKYSSGEIGPDTIAASATATQYTSGSSLATAGEFNDPGELELIVQVDSLSGATAATGYIDYALDDAGTLFYPVDTFTVNGVQTKVHWTDLNFTARIVRVRVINTGATQSNKVQTAWVFKRKL